MIIILILFVIFALLVLFWQISNFISVIFGSLYVKSNRKIIENALKLANLKEGEILYDLGSGNGDTCIIASKMSAKAVGFEISPFYYFWAKLRTWRNPNIKIKFKNINKIDLKKADVVYCYLLPKLLQKLNSKFKKLKSGTRIISIGFPIKDFKNSKKYRVDNHKIFIYKIN